MKKVLFIDRDGTIIIEPKDTYQIDSLERLEFIPGAITALAQIAKEMDYSLVMVTNQDGLGTASYPEDTFWPAQNKMLTTLSGEGVSFDEILIDKTFEADGAETRKPGIGMLRHYLTPDYDLANSFVIGDRLTDVQLAQNLGAQAILFANDAPSSASLSTSSWAEIVSFLKKQSARKALVSRTTNETDIQIELNLDGSGVADIQTGIGFFDHMLAQVAKHANLDLKVLTKGDLEVDEHHSVEDTALLLGEAFSKAMGDKRSMKRFGFLLPMDESLAQVALDFSGRNYLVWEAEFKREKIGEMPTELFSHFFKSFSDTARCTLNIQATGSNEHHKIEAIFKAFAKAIAMAIAKDDKVNSIPSTKGIL
jgi:imidazoleglycerol-phosphate dehydratase/histidinol-phosphatase